MKQVKLSVRRVTSVVAAILCLGASAMAFAQVEAKVTGRVHFDARNISTSLNTVADRDSASVGDNFEVRRARIGIAGTINKDIGYEIVGNGVGGTTNWIDTAWANYGFNKKAQVRVGRFKQPFSMEEQTSSNNISFMERSYGNQMVPGKRLGAMVHGEPITGLTYGVSVYQDGFNELTNQSSIGSKQAARFTFNLAQLNDMKDTVLHIGAGYTGGDSQVIPTNSANNQQAAEDKTRATIVALRTEGRGLNNAYRAQIGGDTLISSSVSSNGTTILFPGLSYGQSANNAMTINQKMRGIELAGARGPFKFQMETMNSKFNASGERQDLNTASSAFLPVSMAVQVKTQYLEFMYNITGESFSEAYKGGNFGGIKPKTNFMTDYGGVVGNGTGAWQVGYRTSKYTADLPVAITASSTCAAGAGAKCESSTGLSTNSRVQNAESATTNTYALNWILNSNARVMFNYAETKFAHGVVLLDVNQSSGKSISGSTDKERVIAVRTQINF